MNGPLEVRRWIKCVDRVLIAPPICVSNKLFVTIKIKNQYLIVFQEKYPFLRQQPSYFVTQRNKSL